MAYIKALHIIFVITWFAGMFYIPRLFIYNTEAEKQEEPVKSALREQFGIMSRRLWYGITWPSAILTFLFGPWLMIRYGWDKLLFTPAFLWLLIKLVLVLLLYIYHFSLHRIFKQQQQGIFRYTSQQLRIWNEVATLFLVSIVMLVVVKQEMSMVWGLAGLVLFLIVLMSAIKIYKALRKS